MQPQSPSEMARLSREAWQALLARSVSAPEFEPPVRRRSRRYGAGLGAAWHILYQKGGKLVELRVKLINAAPEGVMVLSREEVPKCVPVLLTFMADAEQECVLRGKIQHCTSTVGAYKIGVQLCFSATGPGAS
jgi:hypothetical protein